MNKFDRILLDREKRSKRIKRYSKNYQVVVLKANIPGRNKNTKEAYFLVKYFDGIISKFHFLKKLQFDGEDGPYIMYLFPLNKSLKQEMVKIEESDLGRFVDIDVFFNSSRSLSRGVPRRCYICENFAFECNRLQKHSQKDLITFIKKSCYDYIKVCSASIAKEAMMLELNLHPKFGLVTPYSKGSHNDMDYELMIKAQDAIVNDIGKIVELGFRKNNCNLENLFTEARRLGIQIEKKMFKATNNVNAYQGLIFSLGIVGVNLGFGLANKLSMKRIYLNIEKMCKPLLKEGDFGARKEAASGYVHVQELLETFDFHECNLLDCLIYLINSVDDTVFIRRSKNKETALEIKKEFKNLNSSDEDEVKYITEKCIDNNLSFGGCADLLVVALYVNKFTTKFNVKNERRKYEKI